MRAHMSGFCSCVGASPVRVVVCAARASVPACAFHLSYACVVHPRAGRGCLPSFARVAAATLPCLCPRPASLPSRRLPSSRAHAARRPGPFRPYPAPALRAAQPPWGPCCPSPCTRLLFTHRHTHSLAPRRRWAPGSAPACPQRRALAPPGAPSRRRPPQHIPGLACAAAKRAH
ncbi:MAG: hypothetical protein J3K34DRAFT_448899 [Monoraphidium minutum]|nr:MAG: hypothetical protein J3K34DRAFT_448899 [Monoraphidium minutum]